MSCQTQILWILSFLSFHSLLREISNSFPAFQSSLSMYVPLGLGKTQAFYFYIGLDFFFTWEVKTQP